MSTARLLFAFLALLVPAAVLAAADGVSSQSPFLPSGDAAAANAPVSTDYELVGIIASSRQTKVGITNRNTRRSFWVPVGGTVDGVQVVSCEPKQDRAVIKVGGVTQTLSMHASLPANPTSGTAGTATANAPAPANAPTSVQAQKQAEQEKEARLLVSDLLEISIQQRKAYEESQRRAAAEKSGAGDTSSSPVQSAPGAGH